MVGLNPILFLFRPIWLVRSVTALMLCFVSITMVNFLFELLSILYLIPLHVLFIKFSDMSQITLSAILTLIRLAIVLLSKGARLIYSVIDLCDDGVINQSYEKPAWYEHVTRILMLLEDATSSLSNLEDNLTLPQNGK